MPVVREIGGPAVARIRRASRALARELGLVRGAHETAGCRLAEGHALIELGRDGALSVRELAERLRLDKSTASRTASGLVRAGYARLRRDPRDGRVRLVAPTGAGRRVIAELDRHANGLVGRALGFMTSEQCEALERSLDGYARALRKARLVAGCRIRPVRAADDPALARVLYEVRREHGLERSLPSLLEPEEHELHRLFSGRRAAYWVAERDGLLLGGAGVAPLAGGRTGDCELQKMYLLSQGRGAGLGALLLRRCLEWARGRGYRRCYAETMAQMVAARTLYERAGLRRLRAPLGRTGHVHTDAWYAIELKPRDSRHGARRPAIRAAARSGHQR